MSFVSYAQNFEDVMLWRALKHVQNGIYVDVGAQHPVIDSVSKAFYERGWRGIHVEPVLEFAELLRQDRPDETVLQVALADTDGTLDLNVIPGTGLSTAVDAYAQRHYIERGFEHRRISVPVLTLKSALHSLIGKDVHWLKIDVEGFEEQVLRGWDSQTLRPWVLVVEATVPNLPETNFASWDYIVTAAGYQFVYFDGLNRFYVAKEHAELVGAFSCPPNVFDDVQLSGLASSELCRGLIAAHQTSEIEGDAAKQSVKMLSQRTGILAAELDSERVRAAQLNLELRATQEHESHLQEHVEWLQNEWDRAKAKIEEVHQSSREWRRMSDGLNLELQNVYGTKSWRITRPLRQTMFAAGWILGLMASTSRWSLRQSKRMVKFNSNNSSLHVGATRNDQYKSQDPIQGFSPHVAKIYAELKKAIEARGR